LPQSPVAQGLGIAIVVLHQIAGIELSRGRASAEMKHPPNLLEHGVASFNGVNELRRGDVIVELERRKISPFLIYSELVADQNILEAKLIEAPNEGAADEAGSSGDQDLAVF